MSKVKKFLPSNIYKWVSISLSVSVFLLIILIATKPGFLANMLYRSQNSNQLSKIQSGRKYLIPIGTENWNQFESKYTSFVMRYPNTMKVAGDNSQETLFISADSSFTSDSVFSITVKPITAGIVNTFTGSDFDKAYNSSNGILKKINMFGTPYPTWTVYKTSSLYLNGLHAIYIQIEKKSNKQNVSSVNDKMYLIRGKNDQYFEILQSVNLSKELSDKFEPDFGLMAQSFYLY